MGDAKASPMDIKQGLWNQIMQNLVKEFHLPDL